MIGPKQAPPAPPSFTPLHQPPPKEQPKQMKLNQFRQDVARYIINLRTNLTLSDSSNFIDFQKILDFFSQKTNLDLLEKMFEESDVLKRASDRPLSNDYLSGTFLVAGCPTTTIGSTIGPSPQQTHREDYNKFNRHPIYSYPFSGVGFTHGCLHDINTNQPGRDVDTSYRPTTSYGFTNLAACKKVGSDGTNCSGEFILKLILMTLFVEVIIPQINTGKEADHLLYIIPKWLGLTEEEVKNYQTAFEEKGVFPYNEIKFDCETGPTAIGVCLNDHNSCWDKALTLASKSNILKLFIYDQSTGIKHVVTEDKFRQFKDSSLENRTALFNTLTESNYVGNPKLPFQELKDKFSEYLQRLDKTTAQDADYPPPYLWEDIPTAPPLNHHTWQGEIIYLNEIGRGMQATVVDGYRLKIAGLEFNIKITDDYNPSINFFVIEGCLCILLPETHEDATFNLCLTPCATERDLNLAICDPRNNKDLSPKHPIKEGSKIDVQIKASPTHTSDVLKDQSAPHPDPTTIQLTINKNVISNSPHVISNSPPPHDSSTGVISEIEIDHLVQQFSSKCLMTTLSSTPTRKLSKCLREANSHKPLHPAEPDSFNSIIMGYLNKLWSKIMSIFFGTQMQRIEYHQTIHRQETGLPVYDSSGNDRSGAAGSSFVKFVPKPDSTQYGLTEVDSKIIEVMTIFCTNKNDVSSTIRSMHYHHISYCNKEFKTPNYTAIGGFTFRVGPAAILDEKQHERKPIHWEIVNFMRSSTIEKSEAPFECTFTKREILGSKKGYWTDSSGNKYSTLGFVCEVQASTITPELAKMLLADIETHFCNDDPKFTYPVHTSTAISKLEPIARRATTYSKD